MIRLLLAIWLLIWPTFAAAKTYAVRSGEHADFSRLFIPFDQLADWTLGRVDGGYELRPSDKTAEYGLRDVFKLIPRDRIKAIEARPDGRLFLSVTCECHLDAFEINSGLAIDVKDGGRSGGVFETVLTPLTGPVGEVADGQARSVSPGQMASPMFGTDFAQRYTLDRTSPIWNRGLTLPTGNAPKPEMMTSIDPEIVAEPELPPDRVASVRAALVEQLGRAAAQGLVSVDLSETEARLESTRPKHTENPTETMQTPDIADLIDAITGPNVRIETAVDRGFNRTQIPPTMTSDGIGCQPSEMFDIAAWGTEPIAGASLSLSRSSIVGEFDAADPASIEALAKHYIYLTFGAEAAALITAFDAEFSGKNALLAIADIMDAGMTTSTAVGKDQMSCDTNAAMWAVLSAQSLSSGDRITKDAVLTAFAELPLHLRRHLGRFLSEKFLQIDDLDTAAAIRDAIARAPGHHGESFELMNAQISLELGDGAHGIAQLDEIAAADGPLAPEAIISRVNTTLDAGKPLPPDLIETTAAFAFEADGTEMGTAMLHAHLRALAHSGEILDALQKASAAAQVGSVNTRDADTLMLEIYGLAANSSSDSMFLRVALNAPLSLDQSEKAKMLRRSFATRLIALGLAATARDVLAATQGIPGPDDRKLFARSYLLERRPDLAIGYLAGLTDSDSIALRAQSHSLAGEYDRAAVVYAETGDTIGLSRAVWRGEDWGRATETGTDAERAAAELAVQPEIAADDTIGPLARDKDLLERSRVTRERLAKLLDSTVKP